LPLIGNEAVVEAAANGHGCERRPAAELEKPMNSNSRFWLHVPNPNGPTGVPPPGPVPAPAPAPVPGPQPEPPPAPVVDPPAPGAPEVPVYTPPSGATGLATVRAG
jgi:hypothetical protein